tara:strand:- start:196930 stop:197397 length:468 start_codon:yes stop_codon:yes gene_type:complete
MTEPEPKSRYRVSREQQELVVRLIKKLLSMGKYTSLIKTVVSEKFQISRRSVERYIKRARREMIAHMEIPIEQHRAEAYYFYLSVIESEKATCRDRLRARERIDKLVGAEAALRFNNDTRIKITTEEIKNMTDEELQTTYQKIMNGIPLEKPGES